MEYNTEEDSHERKKKERENIIVLFIIVTGARSVSKVEEFSRISFNHRKFGLAYIK